MTITRIKVRFGVDLIKTSWKNAARDFAVKLMFYGMTSGWFTGRMADSLKSDKENRLAQDELWNWQGEDTITPLLPKVLWSNQLHKNRFTKVLNLASASDCPSTSFATRLLNRYSYRAFSFSFSPVKGWKYQTVLHRIQNMRDNEEMKFLIIIVSTVKCSSFCILRRSLFGSQNEMKLSENSNEIIIPSISARQNTAKSSMKALHLSDFTKRTSLLPKFDLEKKRKPFPLRSFGNTKVRLLEQNKPSPARCGWSSSKLARRARNHRRRG